MKFIRAVLLFQAIYYFILATWPIVGIESYMAVTGPKTDLWLRRTISVLTIAIALTILSAVILK